ncbi:DNA-3-methyladenine glycosylase I [Hymenobacter sp. IS2118]|uniref:DNA-3-methyladenine glycosylase I n=1 Tax=Hymenobacter sp. IS2118 TaxID=1505605 RepID=UPI00068F900C|nr:DNA-3-methyladenine glycosylase I [Hymenobacter sp. IS2118]
MTIPRCTWFEQTKQLRDFHDQEWGDPIDDADVLFEYVVLYTFQVGIGLRIVLPKRETMRELLAGFDPARLARFTPYQVDELLDDPRIIRNRRKLEAVVQNARAWLQLLAAEGGGAGLLRFFYGFVGGQSLDNQRLDTEAPPLHTPAAEALSKELKRRGFALLGPATCYGLMQAAGLVNDHAVECPRHGACAQ